MDEAWNVATQVEQCVHLHRGFGRAKVCPRKHRQAQIDCRRVQSIDGAGQVRSHAVVGVEPSGLSDQPVCKLGVDPPVASLVGIRQGRAADRFAKAQVIELGCLRRETHFDITQALSVGQLGERHDPVLFGTGQGSDPVIAVIAGDNPRERAPRQIIHEYAARPRAGYLG